MFRVERASETIDLLVRYIKQEALAPVRGAGRWLAFGLLAAHAIVLSSFFLLLGILRLLQSAGLPFDGGWSWVPYILTAMAAALLIAWSLSRINRGQLNAKSSHV